MGGWRPLRGQQVPMVRPRRLVAGRGLASCELAACWRSGWPGCGCGGTGRLLSSCFGELCRALQRVIVLCGPRFFVVAAAGHGAVERSLRLPSPAERLTPGFRAFVRDSARVSSCWQAAGGGCGRARPSRGIGPRAGGGGGCGFVLHLALLVGRRHRTQRTEPIGRRRRRRCGRLCNPLPLGWVVWLRLRSRSLLLRRSRCILVRAVINHYRLLVGARRRHAEATASHQRARHTTSEAVLATASCAPTRNIIYSMQSDGTYHAFLIIFSVKPTDFRSSGV